ncbi:hypothetical protein DRQ20_06470 [bacterium]|nr:MAG: hypothetical protein DRQ20_06470 [bacterium]
MGYQELITALRKGFAVREGLKTKGRDVERKVKSAMEKAKALGIRKDEEIEEIGKKVRDIMSGSNDREKEVRKYGKLNEIKEELLKTKLENIDRESPDFLHLAELTGGFLAWQGATKTQLRRIYNGLRKAEKYLYFKPLLAYTVSRHRAFEPLYVLLEGTFVKEKEEESKLLAEEFLKAVLAYHLFYGGKD